jgi:glycosyltransferase involved in cell wall biosynthesis
MVLAEAMAAGLDIVAANSGAIPEVLAGSGTLVMPGDWLGIARALADGALQRTPGARVSYPEDLLERYSADATATRLAMTYRTVMAAAPPK